MRTPCSQSTEARPREQVLILTSPLYTRTHTDCLLTQAAVVVAAAALREEDIAQLQAICSRGRIDVIAALQRTGGNVEAAANALLSQER